jgi:hypothetical protein
MTGKKDVTKCFKCDEEFERYLGQLLMSLPDYNLSEIVRQSIMIAGPFLKEHPVCGKTIGIPKTDCQ